MAGRLLLGESPGPLPDIASTEEPRDWYCALGIIDPRADANVLQTINVDVPLALLGWLQDDPARAADRLVTFGSALEEHAELVAANAYLASKHALFCRWKEVASQRWTHLRLHTLYGGHKPPPAHMFAGQMLKALQDGVDFSMSDGMQLREYHHVDDIASSVIELLRVEDRSNLIELSSGQPIMLRDLATAIFTHFNALDRLRIGARPRVQAEILRNDHSLSPLLRFKRDPIEGMIAWFELLMLGGEYG